MREIKGPCGNLCKECSNSGNCSFYKTALKGFKNYPTHADVKKFEQTMKQAKKQSHPFRHQ